MPSTSNVDAINAHNLWIYGGGTLCAETLNVGASSVNAPTASESRLVVVDTQVVVQRDASATGPCVWMGFAELSGNASATYISAGDYAALRVLNVGGLDEAVTIKDEARPYCLQADADEPSSTFVDGLQVVKGKLLLQDNAFLQAEARPLADPIADVAEAQGGYAVFCGNDIEARGNAQIHAKAYGWAISTGSNVSVSGEHAYVRVGSKNAQGIYLEGGLSVSDGARVDATGKLEGVYTLDALSVGNATLTSESETLNAVGSAANINVSSSVVATTSASGFAAFSAEGNIECWCCPDCQKCFSDEAGTTEISRASTVTARLADEQKPEAGKEPAAGERPAAKKVPKTGNPLTALPVAAALLGAACLSPRQGVPSSGGQPACRIN